MLYPQVKLISSSMCAQKQSFEANSSDSMGKIAEYYRERFLMIQSYLEEILLVDTSHTMS